jgi:hypothetical protein
MTSYALSWLRVPYIYFWLFKEAFSVTIYRRMKGWQVNDELERKRSWPNLKLLSRYLPGETEDSNEKPVMIAG